MRTTRLTAAVLLIASVSACSTSGTGASPDPADGGTVTVYAAASLQATFEKLAKEFSARYPGSTVKFSFGGSSGLLTQLTQGAPADVFATADTPTMDRARAASLIDEAQPFATNVLTIATAVGNPKGIGSLTDLSRSDLSVVVCAKPVPCGAATAKVTEAAGVTLRPVSEEDAVSGVLSKVRLGQADAGLVYRTDVKGASDSVDSVDFPQAESAVNVYPIGVLTGAKNPAGAKDFVGFVRGPEGRAALTAAGFGTP
ncbi:Molybdenum ABC transporter, periplasmic molybdate-binding protein OS=Tsukamurella paurometabola (strain ATCC 8368 / DSM / CCUG 35730 / CIP 100753 / JCM 10117 / KCTC 9821 / NBRC 16120 / NCIMB 702349 / NCTC 13040)OX=521096 GN=Tpau_2302 PE=3 SV=1 [Tsukamurella paurometabola]|uniref:Molybdenum ABC transporter, periplasmic molybdate-binding protein n=1 Tax=Tsukamurella paurometabola (strain ATCC 8368 / DSM 20162 / CCUG 35730 / CIP 100753 / JCM 10117 / KCTC 9821 / NBRC 16120 / NCIMB 702349 / NCTC 13040) TaxID=521096 RepID=D5UQD9_TSUPD|nr:molybdate ABC transporter substrate-binding protein [Tsukamurella paurometabola]ADG78909.1 molybdenum ABC transporter, periplasmic molybdate-binding protein [Tsukamurella paurometabola DSM 20162]SUP33483.1 Molybdate-binding periplasmic protein precursor [Tsukamurella paurometabola]